MKTKLLLITFFALIINANLSFSQNNIQVGGNFSENFDGIGKSATASLPSNWKVDKQSSVRTVGDYSSAVTATEYSGGNNMNSNASAGIYNFGAGNANAAQDRAVGFLAESNSTRSGNLYAHFKNNGQLEINSMEIKFNAEKYRNGSGNNGFAYRLFYSLDGANWLEAQHLITNFAGSNDNNGFSNAPAEIHETKGRLLVNVPAGNDLYLCWNYSVTSGGGTPHAPALAIDDIEITNIINIAQTAGWHFRSSTNGSWNKAESWEISEDGNSNWMPAFNGPCGQSAIVRIENSNAIDISTNSSANRIYIGQNASVNNQSGNLEVKGELIVNGNINFNGSSVTKIVLSGSGDQIISGTGTINVNNLSVAKSSGKVILDKPININSELELNGIIESSQSNMLTLGASATVSGNPGAAAYISGPVRKTGTTDFTFPTGKDGKYMPISIFELSENVEFTAEYFIGDPAQYYDTTQKDPAIQHISTDAYWILNKTEGPASASAKVALSWDENISLEGSSALFTITKWTGTEWIDLGNGGINESNGKGTIYSGIAQNTFSPFAIGSYSASAMPVTMVNIEGKSNEGSVVVNWTTASEINNDYFLVERSYDGINFEAIGRVQGAGNSFTRKHYSFTDENPYKPYSYYRITQFDFDGTSETFEIIAVKTSDSNQLTAKAFSNRDGINITVNSASHTKVEIYSHSGQIVYSENFTPSTTDQTINFTSSILSTGLYIVSITDGTDRFVEKVMVRR